MSHESNSDLKLEHEYNCKIPQSNGVSHFLETKILPPTLSLASNTIISKRLVRNASLSNRIFAACNPAAPAPTTTTVLTSFSRIFDAINCGSEIGTNGPVLLPDSIESA